MAPLRDCCWLLIVISELENVVNLFVVLGGISGLIQVVPWQTNSIFFIPGRIRSY